MGGVSGNAGLFSTASDLARIAQTYLNGGAYDGRAHRQPVELGAVHEAADDPQNSSRALLGWDTPQAKQPSISLVRWLRRKPLSTQASPARPSASIQNERRELFIILLTNRVNPTRENDLISEARPAIHTAILATLDRKQ